MRMINAGTAPLFTEGWLIKVYIRDLHFTIPFGSHTFLHRIDRKEVIILRRTINTSTTDANYALND
jgi:hypothetical protein